MYAESPNRFMGNFMPEIPGYLDFDSEILKFSEKGAAVSRKEHIVSVGLDKRLKVYKIMTQKQVLEIGKENISGNSQIKAVGITPDTKFLFTLDQKNLKQWELTRSF